MIKFYVVQIRMGKITIDDVPKKWRDKVQGALDAGLYMPNHVDAVGDEDVTA